MSNKVVSNTYSFVCDPDECDTLIELTTSDSFGFPSGVTELTCPCGRQMSYIGVIINPSTEPGVKVETIAEQYNPNLIVTYKAIEDGQTRYETRKINELEWDMDQFRKLRKKENAWWGKESQLRHIITEAYENSSEPDLVADIARIFDIPLTKTIEYNASINVTGTIEIDMTMEEPDIRDLVWNALSINSTLGEVEVHDFDVLSVEEC